MPTFKKPRFERSGSEASSSGDDASVESETSDVIDEHSKNETIKNDAAVADFLGDDADAVAATILTKAESDSSDSDGEGIDGEDDPEDATPTAELASFVVVLSAMKPNETISIMLARVGKLTGDSTFDSVADAVHALQTSEPQANVQMLSRESLVERAARVALVEDQTLPAAYMLRWHHSLQTTHGPFPSTDLARWAAKGVFKAKGADVCNVNIADTSQHTFVNASSLNWGT